MADIAIATSWRPSMTSPVLPAFQSMDLDAIGQFEGRVVVFVGSDGKLDKAARRVNRLMRGGLERFVGSNDFADLKPGMGHEISWPSGMLARALQVVRLDRRPTGDDAQKAGATIGRALAAQGALVLYGSRSQLRALCTGAVVRAYKFTDHLSDKGEATGPLSLMVTNPDKARAECQDVSALAEGGFFARDLVSEPANVLTTTEFASRLQALVSMGITVETLEADELERLGMRTLLAVGQGSASPSKVVVMQWNGGAKGDAPLALVGKGVVFDTGGISLKPPAGMEEMTMDMGGAAVVAGAMRALALRKAKANVVGIVGLVENMPGPQATRPGDIVRSLKGDTVEIINTDAEGRLVLADLLWYAGERFNPAGMIDLATLTGAIIIALGHDKAGAFSNDDGLCGALEKSAAKAGEGLWRLPLDPAYDTQLKSRLADMKNVGGRPANAITAAQFLQRFVPEGTPWVHLDIAGVALVSKDTALAPKGATGWGVRTLDQLVRDRFES
jgi:leucyl aminopeptidase